MTIEADLQGFDATDKALFPDELTVDPITGELTLTVSLEASFDTNKTLSIGRVHAVVATPRV